MDSEIKKTLWAAADKLRSNMDAAEYIPYAKWAGSMDLMKVVLPPPEIALAFGDLISPMISKGTWKTKQSCGLVTLRDTLLPHLMSGSFRNPADGSDTEVMA